MSEHEVSPPESKEEERKRKRLEYKRAWKAANPEKVKAENRSWYVANREKVQAWRAANREKIIVQARARRAAKHGKPMLLVSPPGEIPPGREIPGLPAETIRVGRDGTVWSGSTRYRRALWRKLKTRARRGTPTVQITIDGQYKEFTVASLVCRAFHGPRPLGCEPFHYPDPRPSNCRADNLRWAPRGTNRLGKRPQGLWVSPFQPGHSFNVGSSNPKAILSESDVREIRALARQGWTQTRLADEFGISQAAISNIVRGASWKHVPDFEQGDSHHAQ